MIQDEPCISGKFCASLSLGIPFRKCRVTLASQSQEMEQSTVGCRGSQEIFLEKTVIRAGNEEPGKLDVGGRGDRRVSGRK